MGISVIDFLNRYFSSDQLKEPLESIGLSVGGTKKERIGRIVENWTSYHRDWYELLDYLDWGTLAQTCEDFNIGYSEYAKEGTLRDKIENEMVLDFRKETMEKIKKIPKNLTKKEQHTINSKRQNQRTNQTSNIILISIIAGLFILGISISYSASVGTFDTVYPNKFDITKEYFIKFFESTPQTLSFNETGILGHGAVGFFTIIGFANLETTSLSANNMINAKVELYPTDARQEFDPEIWDGLPHDFFAYFPNAKNFTDSDDPLQAEKPVIIPLKRTNEPPKIMGSGKLFYARDGEYNFIVFDSDNIPDFPEIRSRFSITYTDNPKGLAIEQESHYDDPIIIKPADSFLTVESKRLPIIIFGLSFAFGAPVTIFTLRNHIDKLLSDSRNS